MDGEMSDFEKHVAALWESFNAEGRPPWESIKMVGTREIVELCEAVHNSAIEEAAGVADAEFSRVMGKQTGLDADYDIDRNIRMCAVLLPNVAESIRSLKKGTKE